MLGHSRLQTLAIRASHSGNFVLTLDKDKGRHCRDIVLARDWPVCIYVTLKEGRSLSGHGATDESAIKPWQSGLGCIVWKATYG
jgi:hypothetical protein